MRLNDWLVPKIIIEKDFDQLKKIMEDPEKANKLIARSSFNKYFSSRKKENITIKKITYNSIIGKYSMTLNSEGNRVIDLRIVFLRKDRTKIKCIFGEDVVSYENDLKASVILAIIFIGISALDQDFKIITDRIDDLILNFIYLAIGLFLAISLIGYIYRRSIIKGIYNRIHNRWDKII